MAELAIETANPPHLASSTQGASQVQGVSQAQAVTSEQGATTEIEQASMWYLYLIRCANGHLYTGITTDVARRFNEHQSNGPKTAKYLRGKGPLTLMYQQPVGTRSDALRREIAVKKLSRAQKLALIESVLR
ncbi:MAG: GIY-YIG nuclease family protein [Shewanella sp.]